MTYGSRVLLTLGAIIISAVAGLLGIVAGRAQLVELLGEDAYVASFQFLLVVVLGGLLGVAFQEVNRQRDKRIRDTEEGIKTAQAELEQLDALADLLVGSYNEVKRIRRLLRGRALSGYGDADDVVVLKIGPYRPLMEELIGVELDFELLARRVHRVLGEEAGQRLSGKVAQMETFMRRIISEYEQAGEYNTDTVRPLSEFPQLADYIGPYLADTAMRVEFVKPFFQLYDFLDDRRDTQRRLIGARPK